MPILTQAWLSISGNECAVGVVCTRAFVFFPLKKLFIIIGIIAAVVVVLVIILAIAFGRK